MARHTAVYGGVCTRELTVAGDGATALFLHGFGHSADCWRLVLSRLSDRNQRAVAVDLPGFGLADQLDRGPILPQLDSFVSSLIDHHARTRPVVVVGNSLGGLLALRAARTPVSDTVSGVVSIDPAGFGWTPLVRAASVGRDLPIKVMSLAGWVPSLIPRLALDAAAAQVLYGRRDRVRRDFLAQITDQLADRARSQRLFRLAVRVKDEVDRAPAVTSLSVPTLVVQGGRDRLISLAAARRVPGSHLVVLPRAGHCPQLDEPDRVADLVTEMTRAEHVRDLA